jgi:hypothetical protein
MKGCEVSDDQNLLELASMYRRLAANCYTPEIISKFVALATEYEAAAQVRSENVRAAFMWRSSSSEPFTKRWNGGSNGWQS